MMTKISGLALGAVLLLAAHAAEAGPRYELEVGGLVCPFCAYAIEKSLGELPGVTEIETHIRDGVVVLEAADGRSLTEEQVRKAVESAGFSLAGFQRLDDGGNGE